MKHVKKCTSTGRPRAFDMDEALNRALQVFWRKGYEGASLSDLTEAMGINRPSLYAAFGNKETIFRKALDRYAEGPAAYAREAFSAPTARETVERLLFGAIAELTNPDNPPGCLLVQGALCCGDEAAPIQQELTTRRMAGQDCLRQRLESAVQDGELPPQTNCAELARYIMAVVHGIGIQAVGGASGEELMGIARTALKAWPTQ